MVSKRCMIEHALLVEEYRAWMRWYSSTTNKVVWLVLGGGGGGGGGTPG